MSALLEVRNLSKAFAQPRGVLRRRTHLAAVQDVSFTLAPGEALGVLGESGSGKTTLGRLVARLLAPDAGRILLSGRDIGAIPPARFARSPLRPAIQMAFQDPVGSLAPHLSGFELVADPVRRLCRCTGARLRARVEDAATAAGLPPELLSRLPHQLSGGKKARIGLARAIAVAPQVLILDEPTAALDVSVQAALLIHLDRLRRERGIALLCISHDLDVVRLLCTRTLVMHAGRVVESGPTTQICASPVHPVAQALVTAARAPTIRRCRAPLPVAGKGDTAQGTAGHAELRRTPNDHGGHPDPHR